MQAAFYIREKQRQRQKKFKRGRFELPSHVATRNIGPFPVYPPQSWGKAATAWADRERRASEAVGHRHLRHGDGSHRRWISRNRIHDSSYGGSSSEEEEIPGLYGHQSAAANALLYVGLGTVAIGLVIAFVGTGEKGFKTLELRLIGPTLIAGGLLCCLLRIFLCVCPTRCLKRKFKRRKKRHISAELNKNDYYRHLPFNARTAEDFMLMEHTNKKTKKRVSILPAGPSTSERRDIPKILLPKEKPIVREGNLIELKPIQSESFEDLPSISSDDSYNLDQSLALFESCHNGSGKGNSHSSERLARLKSTLTFGDSLDAPDFISRDHAVSRIDEEDSEATDLYSSHQGALNSPLLFQHNDSEDGKELVLSPSALNHPPSNTE